MHKITFTEPLLNDIKQYFNDRNYISSNYNVEFEMLRK